MGEHTMATTNVVFHCISHVQLSSMSYKLCLTDQHLQFLHLLNIFIHKTMDINIQKHGDCIFKTMAITNQHKKYEAISETCCSWKGVTTSTQTGEPKCATQRHSLECNKHFLFNVNEQKIPLNRVSTGITKKTLTRRKKLSITKRELKINSN